MSRSGPRSNLPAHFEGYPAYGVVHDVIPNSQLHAALFDFSRIGDYVFMHGLADQEVEPITDFSGEALQVPEKIKKDVEAVYDARRYYKVFNTDTLGVSVVEMDPSKKAAKAVRSVWEKQDFGAVENEARTEIGKILPDSAPQLLFNRVDGVGGRLPGVPKTEVRQKIALMPDTTRYPETLHLISEEADLFIGAIRRRMKQFLYPWDINPHLTFAVFRSLARVSQVGVVVESFNNYISQFPVGVRLGDLDFRHKTERSRNSR